MPQEFKTGCRLIVDAADAGIRLDRYISRNFPNVSRSYAARLISSGAISVNAQPKKPAYGVKAGEIVMIVAAPAPPSAPLPLPQKIDLDIVYEDADLIVIDKPAGLVVHPAPGNYQGTLVNALLYHCPNLGGDQMDARPGIVHRLDKDTSGLIVVAKHRVALNHLYGQFKQRSVQKTYIALVAGCLKTNDGQIDMPIGRHPVDRKKMSVIAAKGRWALTEWTLLRNLKDAALVQVQIKTGRTHQIRVHFAAIGHPVIGDAVYGPRSGTRLADRQMLHAWKLTLNHPGTGQVMQFEADIPDDIAALIRKLEF